MVMIHFPLSIAQRKMTSVEIVLGGASGERPRKLDWLGAKSAEQWLDLLRIKTPLGGIYLKTPKFAPTVAIRVIDGAGEFSEIEVSQPEYFYPHEMPSVMGSRTTPSRVF